MKLTTKIIGMILAIFVAVGIALPGIAQTTSQSLAGESVLETIKKRGVLKIGLDLFVPWSMRDNNGELVGFELDVGRKLAEDMGVEPEFIPTAWDGIIPALLAGKFDVIISGMSVTPQRNLTVNFTTPYAYSGLTILANKEMTKGFTMEDFNNEDVIFSARRGATPAAIIPIMFPKAQLLQFDEDGAATQEVLNSNAHATMSAEPTPSIEVRENPETLYIPFDVLFDQRGEGFALRKGDPDALNYFNNWIDNYTRTGWLEERHNYWFKTEDWKQ